MSLQTTPQLEAALKEAHDRGLLVLRTEKNPYLKISYKGSDKAISQKWNVKIYTSGAIVCTDVKVLQDIRDGTISDPPQALELVQIDDSGWGSVICGAMIGVFHKGTIKTGVVDVSFFQGPKYESKEYLKEYTRLGLEILKILGACPQTHRIEICSGYINSNLRDQLRTLGYDVRTTEIKGPLQDQLEVQFKDHVKKMTGYDFAYDPKKLSNEEIARRYYSTLNWAKSHAPHLLKTGWRSV